MSDSADQNASYTLREEVANGITHGIGTLLSVAALTVLIVVAVDRGSAWHVVGFTISAMGTTPDDFLEYDRYVADR